MHLSPDVTCFQEGDHDSGESARCCMQQSIHGSHSSARQVSPGALSLTGVVPRGMIRAKLMLGLEKRLLFTKRSKVDHW